MFTNPYTQKFQILLLFTTLHSEKVLPLSFNMRLFFNLGDKEAQNNYQYIFQSVSIQTKIKQ